MALSDTEQALVEYYQKSNPKRFAGHEPQDILDYAKARDPQFEQRYQSMWNSVSPVGRAVTSTMDAVGAAENTASSAIKGADSVLSHVPGLEASKNIATDLIGPIGDSYKYIGDKLLSYGGQNQETLLGNVAKTVGQVMSDSSDSAEALTHPDELAVLGAGLGAADGATGGALARKLPGGVAEIKPSITSFPEEALSPVQGPKPPTNFGPQGLADKVKPIVPEEPPLGPRALARQNNVISPGVHGEAAQKIVSGNQSTMHDMASAPYIRLSDPNGEFFRAGQTINAPIDELSGISDAIAPFKEQFTSLPKELQTGTMKKFLNAASGPDTNEATNNAIDEAKGDAVEPEDKGIITLNGMVELRKQLGSLLGKNQGNPTGSFASAAIDGLDKDIDGIAPKDFSKTLNEAKAGWKIYKDTFVNNDHVQALLKSDAVDAHDVLMGGKRGSPEAIRSIRAAGGDDSIANLQKSHLHDLLGQIVGAKSSLGSFDDYFFDHVDAMHELYPRSEIGGLRELASNIDAEKLKYETAVKQNATSVKVGGNRGAGIEGELQSAGTVDPNAPSATPVKIATKQETALEKHPFWMGTKHLADGVGGIPFVGEATGAASASRTMNVIEKLLRAKRAFSAD